MMLRLKVVLIFLAVVSINEGFDLFGWFRSKKPKVVEYKPVSDDQAKQYLDNFGYLKPSTSLNNPSFTSADSFEGALKTTFAMSVKAFQEFAQLKVTGELNDETKKKMAQPRCGVVDIRAMGTTRDNVYKWKKDKLKYSILSDPKLKELPIGDIKKALKQVFDKWSEVVPITFTETEEDDESADIKIKFAKGSHGDPWPFDGKGGVYAHATMPSSGLIHFDQEENWIYTKADKLASGDYVDFLRAALHSVGDALGLQHSRDPEAVMSPFYKTPLDKEGDYVFPRLQPNDIDAAKKLYEKSSTKTFEMDRARGCRLRGDCEGQTTVRPRGRTTAGFVDDSDERDRFVGRRPSTKSWDYEDVRERTSPGSRSRQTTASWDDDDFRGRTSTSSPRSRLGGLSSFGGGSSDFDLDSGHGRSFSGASTRGGCPTSLDAFTPSLDSATNFLFQDNKVYDIRSGRITNTRSIGEVFSDGPQFVEAAFANPRSGYLLLFNSGQVYAYTKRGLRYELDRDFPKRLPSDIGFNPFGAMLWVDGHQLLFSKSGDFAIYDEYWNQATKVDKISNYFEGLPLGTKGGASEGNAILTVVTDHQVFHYDARSKSTTGAPQSLSSYLKC